MKKLITICLALAGMVSTVSAKTIYLVDNWGKSDFYLYLYNSDTDKKAEWPGTSISAAGYLDGSRSYYKLDLEDYSYFIVKYNDGKTIDLTSVDWAENSFFQFIWVDGTGATLEDYASTVYEYNFTVTTTENWDNLYVWMWNPSNNYKLLNVSWPGKEITGSANVYTFTEFSTLESVGLLFDKGDGQSQTCNLTAAPGNNKYNISVPANKIDDSWGLTVKTNASGYATWADAWHAITIPAGIAYCAEDNGDGSATAHSVTNPAANTPMIIKGEPNTTYHFAPALTNETLSYTNALIAGTGSALASVVDGKYNYILNGNAFYAANGMTVGANKAYLQLSKKAGEGTAARILIFPEDEVQGIEAIETVKATDGAYYNLSGQRVNAPMKGLYIQNGKKMIVK